MNSYPAIIVKLKQSKQFIIMKIHLKLPKAKINTKFAPRRPGSGIVEKKRRRKISDLSFVVIKKKKNHCFCATTEWKKIKDRRKQINKRCEQIAKGPDKRGDRESPGPTATAALDEAAAITAPAHGARLRFSPQS